MSGYTRPVCSERDCTGPVVGRRLCRKHYQAAWKAGAFENEPLPAREPAPTICLPEHRHGAAATCYVLHQCRCDDCRDHQAARNRQRNRAKAYGRYDSGLVDVEPVREHMMLLGEFGIGYKRAAELAGIGTTAARTVIWGRQDPGPRKGELQKRIKRETAEKLLAVKPEVSNLAAGVAIPSRGVRRRIQALVTRGWSQSRLAERLDIERANFGVMMTRPGVTVATHRRVVALYDELWNVEPPQGNHRERISVARARNHASQRRWLAPLAWDDIDMDAEPPLVDEESDVDEIAVDLALSGERVRLSSLERRAAVRVAHERRWSDTRTAEVLHLSHRTVLRIRVELELAAVPQGDQIQARAS